MDINVDSAGRAVRVKRRAFESGACGRSQRGVPRSIVPRQGEFALVATERPALILSQPCSVIIVSHGFKAQGDLVI